MKRFDLIDIVLVFMMGLFIGMLCNEFKIINYPGNKEKENVMHVSLPQLDDKIPYYKVEFIVTKARVNEFIKKGEHNDSH